MVSKGQKMLNRLKNIKNQIKEKLKKYLSKKRHEYYIRIGKIFAFLKKILPKKGSGNLMDIAELLANIMTLAVYCAIGPIIAEYEGQEGLFYASCVAAIVMFFFLVYKIACCIGYENLSHLKEWCKKRLKHIKVRIRNAWIKAVDCVEEVKRMKGIKGIKVFNVVKIVVKSFFVLLKKPIVVMGLAVVLVWFFGAKKEYYASVTEVYGNPVGVSEDKLSFNERRNRSGYWEIKDYFFRPVTVLTYVDAYEQTEIMKRYSTAYNMTLFQPSARIVYEYKKNEDKFRSYGKNSFFIAAKKNIRNL